MTPEEYKEQKPVHDGAVHSALKHLTDKEAAFATERYGNYHSPHEGLAIIEEEVDEAGVLYDAVTTDISVLRMAMRSNWFWWEDDSDMHAGRIIEHALHLAQEAIQVAATAQRLIQAIEAKSGEFANLATKICD